MSYKSGWKQSLNTSLVTPSSVGVKLYIATRLAKKFRRNFLAENKAQRAAIWEPKKSKMEEDGEMICGTKCAQIDVFNGDKSKNKTR